MLWSSIDAPYYFWILFMSACKTALISAVLCGVNVVRNDVVNKGANRWPTTPPCGSGGPIIATVSGNIASSVENVRVNWSSRDLRGSTLVGDKHESNTDFRGCCEWSADKLSDCFFLPDGVELVARNNLLRRSVLASFSRGGLLVAAGGSEFGASGSVLQAAPSLPELSFFHSSPLSGIARKQLVADEWMRCRQIKLILFICYVRLEEWNG